MAAVEQDITAEQGAALAVTLTGAGASLQGRTLRMHVRSKVGVITTKLAASTGDGRLTVGADPYTTAALAIGSDVMAAVSVTLPVEYWVYDVESYTTAADVRREWSGRFTITRDVTRDTEADTEDSLAGLVRYDTPQSLTDAQMIQARANIDFAESVRDLVGTTLVAGSNVTITVSDAGDTITIASSGGGGGSISDGDKGDITVSGTGTVWTVDANAITFAKMQAVSANVLLGNDATGTAVEEIACTAAGRALLDDADASAQRTTLGLGTAATTAATAYEASGAVSTHNAVTTAHGISAFGATLVDDADAATARTTLGLGTAATSASGDFATAGHNHSGVYQPADAELTALAGLTSAADSAPYFTGSGTAALMTVTAAGRAILDDADASAQRTTLGLAIGTNVQAYDADLTTWAGITPGTGVGTALGTNVGSAGSVVVNGGALGTPSSGNLANCTGYPGGSGDVAGPASSTDNAVARFDTTTGKLLQNSAVTIADTGATTITPSANASALTVASHTQTSNAPAIDIAQTLNNAAVTFTVEKSNVTNTASAAASLLRDWQVGGVSKFAIGIGGKATTGTASGGIGIAFGGNTSSFPAFRHTGTLIDCVKADLSDVSNFGANNFFLTNTGGYYLGATTSSTKWEPFGTGARLLTSGSVYGAAHFSVVQLYGASNTTLDTGLTRNAAGVVEVNSGTAGTFRDIKVRNLLAGGGNGSYVQTPSMTVANLAAAATAGAGARAFVTDATATTFLSTVAGGGSNAVPVVSDGTNWLIG